MIDADIRNKLDAVLDQVTGDQTVTRPVVDLLDSEDAWDWHTGRDLKDRGAIVASTGTYWAVAVIRGHASASRHRSYAEADRSLCLRAEDCHG